MQAPSTSDIEWNSCARGFGCYKLTGWWRGVWSPTVTADRDPGDPATIPEELLPIMQRVVVRWFEKALAGHHKVRTPEGRVPIQEAMS